MLPAELNAGHRIALQPLDARFTDVQPGVNVSTVSPLDKEAPALFAWRGFYYLVYGDLCCFCNQGSTAQVFVAADPMGEWTPAGNLNPYGGGHIPAQINSIVRLQGRGGEQGGEQLIWTADLWGSAASGKKADDGQLWAPLSWEEAELVVDAQLGHLQLST